MKNALLKFAGFFVEKVPIEQPVGQPPTGGSPARRQTALAGRHDPLLSHFPSPSGAVAHPQSQQQQLQHAQQQQQPTQSPGPPAPGAPQQPQHAPLALALRAWVPQEYATYLAPFGLHVIAAGGELTAEQARAYGAQVLLVSAECLGSHTHLLSHPQLPTIFVAPQPVMMPSVPGVVQVQEPLRASDVAQAARDAVGTWAAPPG